MFNVLPNFSTTLTFNFILFLWKYTIILTCTSLFALNNMILTNARTSLAMASLRRAKCGRTLLTTSCELIAFCISRMRFKCLQNVWQWLVITIPCLTDFYFIFDIHILIFVNLESQYTLSCTKTLRHKNFIMRHMEKHSQTMTWYKRLSRNSFAYEILPYNTYFKT